REGTDKGYRDDDRPAAGKIQAVCCTVGGICAYDYGGGAFVQEGERWYWAEPGHRHRPELHLYCVHSICNDVFPQRRTSPAYCRLYPERDFRAPGHLSVVQGTEVRCCSLWKAPRPFVI